MNVEQPNKLPTGDVMRRVTLALVAALSLLWSGSAQAAEDKVHIACKLVNKENLERIIGDKMIGPEDRSFIGCVGKCDSQFTSRCYFHLPTNAKAVTLSISFAAFNFSTSPEFERRLLGELTGFSVRDVAGIGNWAIWAYRNIGSQHPYEQLGELYVDNPECRIFISVEGVSQEAVALEAASTIAANALAGLR